MLRLPLAAALDWNTIFGGAAENQPSAGRRSDEAGVTPLPSAWQTNGKMHNRGRV